MDREPHSRGAIRFTGCCFTVHTSVNGVYKVANARNYFSRTG